MCSISYTCIEYDIIPVQSVFTQLKENNVGNSSIIYLNIDIALKFCSTTCFNSISTQTPAIEEEKALYVETADCALIYSIQV